MNSLFLFVRARLAAKAVAGVLFLGGILFSCKKDDQATPPPQNPCRIKNDGLFDYAYDAQGRLKRLSRLTEVFATYTFLSGRNLLVEDTTISVGSRIQVSDVTLNEEGFAVANNIRVVFIASGNESVKRQTFAYDGEGHLSQCLEARFNDKGVVTDSITVTLTFDAGNLIKVNKLSKRLSPSVSFSNETIFYEYDTLIANTLLMSTIEDRLLLSSFFAFDRVLRPFVGKPSRHVPTKIRSERLGGGEAKLSYETDERQNITKVFRNGSEQLNVRYECF